MSDQWFYMQNDQAVGPVSINALRELMNAGVIPLDGAVRSEGGEWTEARQLDVVSTTGQRDVNAQAGSEVEELATVSSGVEIDELATAIAGSDRPHMQSVKRKGNSNTIPVILAALGGAFFVVCVVVIFMPPSAKSMLTTQLENWRLSKSSSAVNTYGAPPPLLMGYDILNSIDEGNDHIKFIVNLTFVNGLGQRPVHQYVYFVDWDEQSSTWKITNPYGS